MARPKKTPKEVKSALLQIRMSSDEKRMIERAARLRSLDVSAWVRSEILAVARTVINQNPKG